MFGMTVKLYKLWKWSDWTTSQICVVQQKCCHQFRPNWNTSMFFRICTFNALPSNSVNANILIQSISNVWKSHNTEHFHLCLIVQVAFWVRPIQFFFKFQASGKTIRYLVSFIHFIEWLLMMIGRTPAQQKKKSLFHKATACAKGVLLEDKKASVSFRFETTHLNFIPNRPYVFFRTEIGIPKRHQCCFHYCFNIMGST